MDPFDLRAALLAKHAQHVVLIHFPIALFLSAVIFDFLARVARKPALTLVAYYNLIVASLMCLPVLATGILAWRLQLHGQPMKGLLLQHLLLGLFSTVLIWIALWVHRLDAGKPQKQAPAYRLALELLGAASVALTAHLGGFLSGVSISS
jgi:uncharacterized membrane protein